MKHEIFENESVTKALIKLALPTVIGQIILVIYNMADTFFVGQTGNDAMLTAVTICMPAFMFLSAISNLFGIGGASVIARAIGTGDESRASSASALAFWGCLFTAAVYSITVLIFRDLFVDALGGTDRSVHSNAVEYVTVTVTIGGISTAIASMLSHLIRAEGRAMQASLGIAVGGVANIALDPLFMFVILPPGHEAMGAAIATALSNLISLIFFVVVLFCIRKHSHINLKPTAEMTQKGIPIDILSAGIPACVMTLFENISFAVLDKLISFAGVPMQAGIGVAKKLNMLAHSIVRGIAQGALPLIGYHFASKNYKRMCQSFQAASVMSVSMATACMTVCLIFAKPFVNAFIHTESESMRYGVVFLRILCLGGPFSALAYTVISFFQAVGSGKKSFILAILRKGIVDIPLMIVLNTVAPIYGVVSATPVADIVCCTVSIFLLRRYLISIKMSRRFETEDVK